MVFASRVFIALLVDSTPISLLSLSPRLGSSTPDDEKWRVLHDERRHAPENMLRLIASSDDHQVKLVIGTKEDLVEAN